MEEEEEDVEEEEEEDSPPQKKSLAKIVLPSQDNTPPPTPTRKLRSSPGVALAVGMYCSFITFKSICFDFYVFT